MFEACKTFNSQRVVAQTIARELLRKRRCPRVTIFLYLGERDCSVQPLITIMHYSTITTYLGNNPSTPTSSIQHLFFRNFFPVCQEFLQANIGKRMLGKLINDIKRNRGNVSAK